LSVAPVFGHRGLPQRARLALAVVLTWMVLPLIPPPPALEPLSPAGLAAIAQQLLIGLSMGFMLRLVLGALEVAGQVIALQMGLGFALLVDPQNSTQLPLLSAFFNLLGILLFLSLNGHLAVVQLVVESFRTLPIGTAGIGADEVWTLAGWASRMFAGSVLIALPAIASLLVVNLAFGVMSRAAPQFNIFAVGFPLTLLLGMLILLFSLPLLLPQLRRLLTDALQALEAMTGGP
ncbi:MAG: flagellar biosynthetic protein FliR, partial [Pseudomonadota bacterium]|nr:flagellar biosynthetic protein FliR [Pseudomonadota bacterium]